MFYTVVRRCWAVSSIDTVRKELHPWTSSSGEIRYYVNDWFDLIGDVLESFVQNEWNAPPLEKIKRAKVWFDSSAHVHVDGLKDYLTVEIIRSNLEDRFFQRLNLLKGSLRQTFICISGVYRRFFTAYVYPSYRQDRATAVVVEPVI